MPASFRGTLFSCLAAGLLFLTADHAEAGKPDAVVEWSNGFPSGEHYNLNIHGKKADFICDSTGGGGSVFVPEYGQSIIQFIQNKLSSLTEMQVLDACSFSANDPARVQLPTGEYQVYARILGKPGKQAGERSVVFYPKLIDACSNLSDPDFGTYTECNDSSLLTMGKITVNGVFDKDSMTLDRIAPLKGANKAQNITPLFQWSGYVCDATLDVNLDGEITVGDVAVDLNGDGIIDEADLALLLSQSCTYFQNEWIFNIADLVTYGWDYMNSGSKLVNVRFYPVRTTEFTRSGVQASALSGTSPLTVRFSAPELLTAGSGKAKNYRWSFGDGKSATGKNVKHTFVNKSKKKKTFKVSLTRSGNGKTSRSLLNVKVAP